MISKKTRIDGTLWLDDGTVRCRRRRLVDHQALHRGFHLVANGRIFQYAQQLVLEDIIEIGPLTLYQVDRSGRDRFVQVRRRDGQFGHDRGLSLHDRYGGYKINQ
jgi:hypothetical protein